ncbi:MAG: DUF6447 family protein [Halomonas sp.]|uniref:DUF6447 family protein n=1 Tax=Halomonas sp. TaxID=1486246 RepID=UPI002ACE8F3D|nr:DUF6447 family protein [Halomonas sp.]MDZ7853749.1 DUF6447 family protein [Halomonas sp.]
MAEKQTERTVTIDGKEYQLDSLSEKAKKQLVNLRITDEEIQRLNHQLSIAQTARSAYANALKQEIEGVGEATAH